MGDSTDSDLRGLVLQLPTVRDTLGLDLTDQEQREDLGQAFEGAPTDQLVTALRTSYRGGLEDGAASVQLAQYETVEAAAAAAAFIHTIQLGDASTSQSLDLRGVADESYGRVFPPSANNSFVTTAVLLRVGRVVAFITVLSHVDGGLADQTRDLAEFLVMRIQHQSALDATSRTAS